MTRRVWELADQVEPAIAQFTLSLALAVKIDDFYVKNSAAKLAKEIIAGGEIGDVVHFRGTHVEDFMADPELPYSWRCQRRYTGAGSLGDLLVEAIADDRPLWPDFRAAWQVQQVVEAVERSAAERAWVSLTGEAKS